MNIVVLDGYTLNPGDLTWVPLENLGHCTIHDRTPAEEVAARTREAEIVLTNKTDLNAATLQALPKLQYIAVLATGYNIVDVDAARARGIPVSNVPTYGTESVAQMTFAHILNLTQHVGHHARTVQEGRWCSSRDFCYWDMPLAELAGLTLGLVGLGRIGRAVARIGLAFGMRVVACDPVAQNDGPNGCTMIELDDVFRRSDVVSLHCPLTADNAGLVNAERLALMKPRSLLINTSRGALIDERALADALQAGRIAGAGLDVLAVEPPGTDNPLLTTRNCYVTPHIAWATRAARQRLLDVTVENVAAFLEGRLQNVVNS
ncbi:MAG: D-2-hydroxyacid dehydrogenase [Planctomycetota bacterium]|jgi:glycerate dehydrogenase